MMLQAEDRRSATTLTIPSADGTALHARLWTGNRSRGGLVIAHGLGEHSGCYDHVARELTSVPELVDVLAFDFRGHGLSPGRRGVVRRYEELVADLRAVLAWWEREQPHRPRFVLGHSNGGQVALRVARDEPEAVSGVILSNPFLGLAAAVPAWKRFVGRVLHRVAPWVTLSAAIGPEAMTRDQASWTARRSDPLRHDRISAPYFFGMLEGARQLHEQAGAIRTPCLMLLGGADCVTDPAAARDFFDRLGAGDKTLRVFAEMRHEPLNELGRELVQQEIIAWLADRPGRLVPLGRRDSRAGA